VTAAPYPGADEVERILEDARDAGFLGPGPIESHIAHATGFGDVAETALGRFPESFADLGTGGGVPGLVLASRWSDARCIFIESNRKRCEALRWAIVRLGFDGRAVVVEERAELVGRDSAWREQFELVTARGFAPSAPTAEIAAGLVAVGGAVVVSEPPEPEPDRWPAVNLREVGLGPAEMAVAAGAHFAVMRKAGAVPEEYPRRVGRPAKRPLW
jgi:16S rRNA (guanine527-N7)-methyltransferase